MRPSNKKNGFGQRLKKARESLGLTQADFGARLGFTWYKIKDMETGRQKIQPDTALLIEKKFAIDFRWLLTGEGAMISLPPPAEGLVDRARPEGKGPELYEVVEPVSGKATIVSGQEMRQIHRLLRILKSDDKGVVQAIGSCLREFERLSRLVNARFGDIILLERRVQQAEVENNRRKNVK
jgi:transcriptional regulator with XRE-family HTH domain